MASEKMNRAKIVPRENTNQKVVLIIAANVNPGNTLTQHRPSTVIHAHKAYTKQKPATYHAFNAQQVFTAGC